ncbi:LPS assembly lipoprotein LptE [Herbaspirillum sp. alder98]|uniref:LPS-assembly lipoprotein LptE n=1 Tax=Herbaspirillum sp. alder98 TaxID=2913096 RepID=UPI001CD908F2|nr:LPS assembly lipoprotein LptE [Herbaspirillum sp. alder98]MCA1325339.1 LPS assembly lipoprotein LptE [Herbaspirillum sp. alder98]
MHLHHNSKRIAQWLLSITVVMLLTACGFHLRGAADLPFKTIYLGFSPNSTVGVELRRNIRASGGEVVDKADQAEAVLKVLADTRDKQVLTLNTNGRVREYALFQRFTFSVADPKGVVLIPPTAIVLRRVITYDENQELAKQAEEVLLYRDMQSDLVQQILRRLAASKTALATENVDPEP